MSEKPSTVFYENIKSGAKISGTVYNQLNNLLKGKYRKLKGSKAPAKKVTTPKEAK